MTSDRFDYIIIGAGSAGCVLANRLSENPKNKVLLIEAGGSDQKFWIKVPLGYAFTFADPKVNWKYKAQTDKQLNNRQAYWPRGRVIGGSSSINAMAYLRGLPHDFNDWEKAGATGWNWDNVKAVYERIESHSEIDETGHRTSRGDGPVSVWDNSDQMHPFSDNFLQAARQMQWPVLNDLNSDQTEGLSYVRATVKNGKRWSSADAFLHPALKRQNLKMITHARVEKIHISDKTATGLTYQIGDQKIEVHASKDIILSAGAINSPQLLQLSGLGPSKLLKQHGIDVIDDLGQVGQGLQDHLAVSHYFRATKPTLNNKLGNWPGKLIAGAQYILTQRGPLSIPVNQVSGYVRSDAKVENPDIQIYCNPGSYITKPDGKTDIDKDPGFLLCVQPSRPTSRGSVNIASNNPSAAPSIQPNSLSTDHDRQMVIKASHLLQQLAQTPIIKQCTEHPIAPDIIPMNNDELLDNFQKRAGTVFHPTCTCRMGVDATDSVLNNRLQVHGVNNLRVVDASSFPNITSGNTNAPTLMLASRAADLILQN